MFEDDVYYFFFFFKQKTAYEMRISDWSSDVCSSDLTYWREQDPDRFLWVFVFTMGMLLAPKLMGFIATMFDRDLRRGCGGAVRTFIGMLLETLLAALMAPVTMYVQSRGVAEVLAGKDSGWESQRRDDGRSAEPTSDLPSP